MAPVSEPAGQLPVFVYGTLRPRAANAHVLDPYVVRSQPARLRGHRLYALEYPCIIECPDEASEVAGDLVWIGGRDYDGAIEHLDWFEGYVADDAATSLYERVARAVQIDGAGASGGEPAEVHAWVYLAGTSLRARITEDDAIAGDDWLAPRG